jgi:hypothetical protein
MYYVCMYVCVYYGCLYVCVSNLYIIMYSMYVHMCNIPMSVKSIYEPHQMTAVAAQPTYE